MISVSVSVGDTVATTETDIDHWAPDVVADMVRHTVKAALMVEHLAEDIEAGDE